MTISDNLIKILKVFFALCALIVLYFSIFSSSGLIKMYNLSKQLEVKENKLASLEKFRIKIDSESKMLSKDSIDLDFLEEQARIQFNKVGKNEIQINLD